MRLENMRAVPNVYLEEPPLVSDWRKLTKTPNVVVVAPYHNGKLASCFASSRVTIHESLVTIPISATESGEAAESGVVLA